MPTEARKEVAERRYGTWAVELTTEQYNKVYAHILKTLDNVFATKVKP